jgi:hypothetical protein
VRAARIRRGTVTVLEPTACEGTSDRYREGVSLAVCPTCTRHRHVSEAACPFCGDKTPLEAERRTTKTLSRVAIVLGVTAAVGAAGAKGYIALQHHVNVGATNASYGSPGL